MFEDGVDIFRCLDAQILHFQKDGFVFLFTAAFGMTARVVKNDRVHDRNIGRRRLTLTDGAINAFHETCDNSVIKSLSFGNARCGASIQPTRSKNFFNAYAQPA